MEKETNRRVNRILQIRRLIKEKGACPYCMRKWAGQIKRIRRSRC